MKKTIALLLSLVLALCLCAASAEDNPGVVTTFYVTDMSADNGETLMPISLAGIIEMSITFYDDQTAVATANTVDGENTLHGTYTDNNTSLSLSFEDGSEITVTMTDDGKIVGDLGNGTLMYLSMTPPAAAEPLADVVKANDITAFNGTWAPEAISAFGVRFTIEEAMEQGLGSLLGESVISDIVIRDGSVDALGLTGIGFIFSDGLLVWNDETSGTCLTISLLADGSLTLDVAIGGMSVSLIYSAK